MILLKKLTLSNFLSHELTELNFEPNQKLLIDGNSGSGKSSIMEAIVWVLYGEGRTSNVALVRTGADKAEVSLTLDTDLGEVKIVRSVNKSKHTLQVIIDGVAHPFTGVRELQNWIETELTGASYMLFVNSIAYVQGGPDSFVTQNATKRKDLLLEIIKTIDFDAYYEKTKSKITQEEKELIAHEQTVLLRKQWLDESQAIVANKKTYEDAVTKLDLEEDVATKSKEASVVILAKINEQLKTIDRVEKEKKSLEEEIKVSHQEVTSLENEAAALSIAIGGADIREKTLIETDINATTADITSINAKLSEAATVNANRIELLRNKPIDLHWNTKAEDVNKELSDPENHNKCSNTECPYYASKKDRLVMCAGLYAEYTQKQGNYEEELRLWQESYDVLPVIDVQPLQSNLTDLQLKLQVFQRELQLLVNKEGSIKRLADIAERIKSVNDLVAHLSEVVLNTKKEIDELRLEIDEESLAKHRQNLLYYDNILVTTRQEKAKAQQMLGTILDREQKIPETKQLVDDTMKLIDITKTTIYRLNLLKEAFGSKGIKSIVIDYILPELEEKINHILSQMSDFRVVLDTQMEKADGEGNKEGLFITIINDMGEEMPMESYSGGEKLKIIVSITEALATLQKCSFRLYDEIFLGLDVNSLESFVKVLDNLLQRFPQVICISHLEEIKVEFEHKLLVTKRNGTSYVK